jgi:hypothetical protein
VSPVAGGAEPRGAERSSNLEHIATGDNARDSSRATASLPSNSTGAPARLVADVLSGALEAALVEAPVGDPRPGTNAVFDEELVLVTRSGHRAP